MPSQKILWLLQVLTCSRPQLESCSIPNPKHNQPVLYKYDQCLAPVPIFCVWLVHDHLFLCMISPWCVFLWLISYSLYNFNLSSFDYLTVMLIIILFHNMTRRPQNGTTIYQNYQEIPERLWNTGTAQKYVCVVKGFCFFCPFLVVFCVKSYSNFV